MVIEHSWNIRVEIVFNTYSNIYMTHIFTFGLNYFMVSTFLVQKVCFLGLNACCPKGLWINKFWLNVIGQ